MGDCLLPLHPLREAQGGAVKTLEELIDEYLELSGELGTDSRNQPFTVVSVEHFTA